MGKEKEEEETSTPKSKSKLSLPCLLPWIRGLKNLSPSLEQSLHLIGGFGSASIRLGGRKCPKIEHEPVQGAKRAAGIPTNGFALSAKEHKKTLEEWCD